MCYYFAKNFVTMHYIYLYFLIFLLIYAYIFNYYYYYYYKHTNKRIKSQKKNKYIRLKTFDLKAKLCLLKVCTPMTYQMNKFSSKNKIYDVLQADMLTSFRAFSYDYFSRRILELEFILENLSRVISTNSASQTYPTFRLQMIIFDRVKDIFPCHLNI